MTILEGTQLLEQSEAGVVNDPLYFTNGPQVWTEESFSNRLSGGEEQTDQESKSVLVSNCLGFIEVPSSMGKTIYAVMDYNILPIGMNYFALDPVFIESADSTNEVNTCQYNADTPLRQEISHMLPWKRNGTQITVIKNDSDIDISSTRFPPVISQNENHLKDQVISEIQTLIRKSLEDS